MRRLFYKGILADEIEIVGEDAHHLMYAMRAKAGDRITVVDDRGQVAEMEMTEFTPDTVTMRLVEHLDADTESPISLTLAQCLLKADKMDYVVQKAVELGATRIVPVASRNCVVRYDAKKAAQRQARWQKIADEAAKQCGRTRLLTVEPIQMLPEYLEHVRKSEEQESSGTSGHSGTNLLFCYENETKQPIGNVLRDMQGREYSLLIGPEGGFTLDEAQAAEQAGGKSVTLGPRILRAETAAVAALTIVQYAKGDLGSCQP